MSSLTESFIISDIIRNTRNDNWYDKVYLCVEKNSVTFSTINGFNCYAFNNFKDADAYYSKNKFPTEKRVVMIPICKWVPLIFHKHYLNKKLMNIYWHNNITMFRKSINR
jgi:hypothetical protein